MATIVVGGSGKGVGKTALICGLLASLPEIRWTCVKITSHAHTTPAPIFEDHVPGQETDTARFLAAGAHRALLVTAVQHEIPIAAMEAEIGSDGHVIFESNEILKSVRPEVSLGVIDRDDAEVKPSFESFVRHADAVVTGEGVELKRMDLAGGAEIFQLEDFQRISPAMLGWVRARLKL